MLTSDAQLAAEATPELDDIAAQLVGQLSEAVNNLRDAMSLQQAAIKARLVLGVQPSGDRYVPLPRQPQLR